MRFAVESFETAKWCVDRIITDVDAGDVIVFQNKDDADHFVDQGRARHITEDEIAAALAAAEAGDADEGDDGEDGDDANEPAPAPVAAPAPKKKRGK
jgi:hypothetical protein